MNKKLQRWIPAAVVPVAIAAAAIAVPAVANASPSLPGMSPQQLLELVASSAGTPFSGTVEQTSALGLPDLSSLPSDSSGAGASTALELLSGAHTAHVFVGGADTQRVQVLDGFAERDAIRNGDELWLYDSDAKEATHATSATASSTTGAPQLPVVTPAEAAQKLLAAVDPSTDVEVVDTATVAGRAAYELRLTPSDDDTLVGSVVLSVDAETGLPLAATVTATGQTEPAFSVRFSEISFDTPDASLFEFTPPAGVTVEEQTLHSHASDAATDATVAVPTPTTVGDGWDTVVVLPAGIAPADLDDPLLDRLTTAVDGGRVLGTSLVSVLVADDGRVLVGAVSPEYLQSVAAQ